MDGDRQRTPQDAKRLRKALNVFEGYVAEWRLYSEDLQEKAIDLEVRMALGKYVDWLEPYLDDDDPLAEIVSGLRLVFPASERSADPPFAAPMTYRRATNVLLGLLNGLKDELSDSASPLRRPEPKSLTVRIQDPAALPRPSATS